MTIEERFRRFFDFGYAVRLKSHELVSWTDAGDQWARIMWQERIKESPLNKPHIAPIGWTIDGIAMWPDSQDIHSGVFVTIEQALEDAEKLLEKYAKPFRELPYE